MKEHNIKYVGIDATHKNTIFIAIADQERDSEIQNYGTIPHMDYSSSDPI